MEINYLGLFATDFGGTVPTVVILITAAIILSLFYKTYQKQLKLARLLKVSLRSRQAVQRLQEKMIVYEQKKNKTPTP